MIIYGIVTAVIGLITGIIGLIVGIRLGYGIGTALGGPCSEDVREPIGIEEQLL